MFDFYLLFVSPISAWHIDQIHNNNYYYYYLLFNNLLGVVRTLSDRGGLKNR